MVKTAKKYLSQLRRPHSLEYQALRTIAKHAPAYLEQRDFRLKLQNLSNDMRNGVLRVLQSMGMSNGTYECGFETFTKCVYSLCNSETQEIDLEALMVYRPVKWVSRGDKLTTQKVLQEIARLAPSIRKMKVGGCSLFSFQPPNDHPALLKCICAFKKLESLHLCQKFLLRDLMKMCAELPCLKHLEVDQVVFSEQDFKDPENFKRSFSGLETFNFTPLPGSGVNSIDLAFFCMEELPDLQIVQGETKNFKFRRLPSKISSLTHLNTCPTTAPLRHVFPHVTNLAVRWRQDSVDDQQHVNPLLEFENVTSLRLENVRSVHVLEQFLCRYGAKLKTLEIDLERNCVPDFDRIVSLCPALRIFKITDDDSTDYMPQEKVFTSLTTFSWNMSKSGQPSKGVRRLSQILSSPMLEEVEILGLSEDNCDVDDLTIIAKKISTNSILGELQAFKISCHKNFHKRRGRKKLSKLGDVIHTAYELLPKLSKLELLPMFTLYDACMHHQPFEPFVIDGVRLSDEDYQYAKSIEWLGGNMNLVKTLLACRKHELIETCCL